MLRLTIPAVEPDPEARAPSSTGTGLNVEQERAVRHGEGPLLIVAGPGTGKTWTVVQRIAHLLRSGLASPRAVTAITFTRKAADELRARLTTLLPDAAEGAQVTATTFHAFGLELLRALPEHVGLPRDFVVIDEMERGRLVEAALAEVSGESRRAGRWADRIGRAKAQLVSPEEAEPELAPVYAAYQRALRRARALDFDDLVVEAVQLLESSEEALAWVHDRCRFLFIDEYQDINAAQYRLTGKDQDLR